MMAKSLVLTLMVMTTMLAMGDAATLVKDLCNVSKTLGMTDFDPQRYVGLWYPTHVIADHPLLRGSLNTRSNVTHDPAAKTSTSDVAIYYKDGSCYHFDKIYKIGKNGVMTNESLKGEIQQKIVKTILKTDYNSVVALLLEVYFNGKIHDGLTDIFLSVRDPTKETNYSVVADTLRSFCGDNAGTINFFRSLNVNVTKTCDDL